MSIQPDNSGETTTPDLQTITPPTDPTTDDGDPTNDPATVPPVPPWASTNVLSSADYAPIRPYQVILPNGTVLDFN